MNPQQFPQHLPPFRTMALWGSCVRAAPIPPPTLLDLARAIEVTLARKVAARRRPKYIASLRQYLRAFARGRENTAVKIISPSDIETWFLQRGESPAATVSNLGRLSTLFRTCLKLGVIERNPCDAVERPTIEQPFPQILSIPQCKTILERTAGARALAYLVLCLFAGLRPDEAKQTTWDDIDLEVGLVRVSASVSKVRRRRIVHLLPTATAWLQTCRGTGLPLSLRHQRYWRHDAASWLGFTSWPHDVLRHTAASYWLASWRDAGRVAMELGNSPAILFRHYRELVTPSEAEAFWSLRPSAGKQMEFRL